MKQSIKSIFLFSVLFFTSQLVWAQVEGLPQFEVGVRAGANYSSFRALENSDILNNKESTFIMVGGFAQVRFLKKFGLRAEILSNPKGALVNYYDSGKVQVEAVRKLSSTDATLSLSYNFTLLKVIGVYAFGGYSYENLNFVRDEVQKPTTEKRDLTNSFREEAHSVIGGLGLRIRVGDFSILPEIRYLHGLTDLVKSNVKTKNQVITASLGISLAL